MIKKITLYSLVGVAVLLLLFVVSNYNYFWQHAKLQTGQVGKQDSVQGEKNYTTPNTLFIPSLSIEAPIQFVSEKNENVFQDALQNGVVQYPDTAPVGTVGNTYIFGHSSDFALSKGDYKTVFALLPNIELGSEIRVTDATGKQFVYEVIDKFVAKKTDLHLLDQNTNGKAVITLQTSYPIGTALQRYIVKATLRQ